MIGRQQCTATVVAPKLLVSAAHCFISASPGSEVRIHQGSSVKNSSVQNSRTWAVHPDFCGKANCGDDSFDYAYVIPTTPIELDTYPRPLTTQQDYDAVMREGTPLTLVGFGQDDKGLLGVKRKVESRIRSFRPRGRQFLTAGEGRDSCRGDSGGPAFGKDPQGALVWLGVLSAGSKECGQGGYYGVPLSSLAWLERETAYNPGGCLTESCLSLARPKSPGQNNRNSRKAPATSKPSTSSCNLQPWGGSTPLPWITLLALVRIRRGGSKLKD